MHIVPYAFLLLSLMCALGGATLGIFQLWQGRHSELGLVEKATSGVAICLSIASAYLVYALWNCDFSLEYVYSYTDSTLPLFYRLTAFWGGQAGSLLFWALMVALCGAAFQFTPAYKQLHEDTRLWFGLFFLGIMAFFGLLLCCWSNPFITLSPAPADGRGLNPLLQNFGMIIHPPLLFLGYGGFVIPGCLAMAQAMNRADSDDSWINVARPFTMTAWLFLTAGIVLGAWWAYMELGWGGYWAWDPVENASLLPWLIGTAALHTCIVESRRQKLHRVNIFLMTLTTVSAFFATWLVRGNVVDSVHAFGDGGVGTALLVFVLAFTALAVYVAFMGKVPEAKPLENLESREGFLVLVAWLLLALSLVILVATLWPLISSLWSARSQGLEASFYNRVCLPLFIALLALLCVCPWLKWQGGLRKKPQLAVVGLTFVLAAAGQWFLGYQNPLALVGGAVCVAALVSSLLMLSERAVYSHKPSLAAYGVHIGLALLALGICFSGPYKLEKQVDMAVGDTLELGPYTVQLRQLYEGRGTTFTFLEAELGVSKNGGEVEILAPQRRIYNKFDQQAFAEAALLPSLNNEFYAAFLGLTSQQHATLHLSTHPMVNWLWIGGVLMCLFPFLSLGRRKRSELERD